MTKKRIKLLARITLAIGTTVSLFFVPWILVWAWILPLPDTVQEQVDEAIGHGFDGMIVYVDEAGKEPAFYTGGWKDRDLKIPADPHSLFKIGSISKLYVAVAVAKLANDGSLSLDKTLAAYLPDLVGRIENAETITLRSMVQHRSGIPNYTDYPGYWENGPKSIEQSLNYVLDEPAYFEPDEKYGYSNTNFLLIGRILDNTLGYSHHQYVKKEILKPLDLHNTYSLLSEVNLDDLSSGYYVGYKEDMKYYDLVGPSGSMIATAQDVGIFLRALNDGTLLNEDEQAIYSSIYVYEHTGLILGYQSIAKYHKDIDAVVIQFVNTTNFDGYTFNLSQVVYGRIMKILRREKALK